MINIERHIITGEFNPVLMRQEFKTRCEMRRLSRTLEEHNKLLKNAETLPAIKKSETSKPQLHGIPFLDGGREGFFKNLQTLTAAGIITTRNNRYIIHATNKAAAHRVAISIFVNAIEQGIIQNFLKKEEGQKIKWSYLRDNFNFQISGKEAANFTHTELSIQFENFFNVYVCNFDTDFYSDKILKSFICAELAHVQTLTKVTTK